jgi:hypothetical protein
MDEFDDWIPALETAIKMVSKIPGVDPEVIKDLHGRLKVIKGDT